MKSAITVSLVAQVMGGPFVYWDGLDDAFSKAAALGFDAVEIFPSSPAELDVEEVKALAAKHGCAVAAVGTGAGWVVNKWTLTHADPAVRTRAMEFVADMIDVAGRLGAPAIIGSMQGRWEGAITREEALGILANSLEELGERAARHGVPLLYEPLNRYETNLINTVSETADFLRSLRTKNVQILADLFHMNIEELDLAAALRMGSEKVGHVHFADSNRRAIGLGHTAIAPVIAALREIGYRGYLSAEIVPLPNAETAARWTIDSFRAAMAAPVEGDV